MIGALRFITGFFLLFSVSNVLEENSFFYNKAMMKEINKLIIFLLGTPNTI